MPMSRFWPHLVWFVVAVSLVVGCDQMSAIFLGPSLTNKTFSITTIRYRNDPSPVPLHGFFSNLPQAAAATIQFQSNGLLLLTLYDSQGGQVTQVSGNWSLSQTGAGVDSWKLALTGEGLGQLAGTWYVSQNGGTLTLSNRDWTITGTQAQG